MVCIFKNESFSGLMRHRFNPFLKIEEILREKKLRKQERELKLKLAVFSGGITRMK